MMLFFAKWAFSCILYISLFNYDYNNKIYNDQEVFLMAQNYDYLKKITPESSNLIRGLQAVQAQEGYVSDEVSSL